MYENSSFFLHQLSLKFSGKFSPFVYFQRWEENILARSEVVVVVVPSTMWLFRLSLVVGLDRLPTSRVTSWQVFRPSSLHLLWSSFIINLFKWVLVLFHYLTVFWINLNHITLIFYIHLVHILSSLPLAAIKTIIIYYSINNIIQELVLSLFEFGVLLAHLPWVLSWVPATRWLLSCCEWSWVHHVDIRSLQRREGRGERREK